MGHGNFISVKNSTDVAVSELQINPDQCTHTLTPQKHTQFSSCYQIIRPNPATASALLSIFSLSTVILLPDLTVHSVSQPIFVLWP